jgi:DNA polymerase-3 subunit beta
MKLSVLQENLAAGLSLVAHAVAAKGSLPILSHLLLRTDGGRLRLAATNLETGIVTWVGAKVETEGALSVPARLLTELVSSLPPGKLTLTVSNQILSVESDRAHSRLNGVSADEFPNLPTPTKEPILALPPEVLSQAVGAVAFAAATDEARPVLTGVLFKVSDSRLTLVGVDGFRLSERRLFLEKAAKNALSLVIPARTLSEVARAAVGLEGPLLLYLPPEENQVIFKTEAFEISSRLLEGEFPDYEKIIPQNFVTRANLEVSSFSKAVRLAAIFAKDSANIVKLKFLPAEGKLLLSANTAEVGENETELEGELSGEVVEIAFNAKYLLDCLAALAAEKITFQVSGPLNPGLIRIVDDPNFLHLIMPVRVQS